MRSHHLMVLACLILMASGPLQSIAGGTKIQKKDLPAAVLSAFKIAYPGAVMKGLTMEKERGSTFYKIGSVEGKTSRELLYRADGSVARLGERVPPAKAPEAVRAAASREHPKGNVRKCERTVRGQEITYELAVHEGNALFMMKVSPDGKVFENRKYVTPKPRK